MDKISRHLTNWKPRNSLLCSCRAVLANLLLMVCSIAQAQMIRSPAYELTMVAVGFTMDKIKNGKNKYPTGH